MIGPKGILNDKTRLFVTNSLNFLPEMDLILFIENGSIKQSGSYAQLTEKTCSIQLFNKFIESYFLTKDANTSNIGKFYI